MSIKIMSLVWEKGPQNQAERFVLLALADFANDAGECWPSVDAIAAKTCFKERGVRQILRRLEDAGWLATAIGGGRHGCNNYRINPAPHAPLLGEKPGMVCPPAPNAPRHETTNTRHMTAQNPAPHAPEPSRTIKEPSLSRIHSFEAFWDAYPHRDGKRGKKPSAAKFERVIAAGVSAQTVIDAAKRYAADKRVRDGFAKDPITWLNQAGWEDEIASSPAKAASPTRNEFWRKVAGAAQ